MSRNVRRCPRCRAPLLHTRRSGKVKAVGGGTAEAIAGGMLVRCRCGLGFGYATGGTDDGQQTEAAKDAAAGAGRTGQAESRSNVG